MGEVQERNKETAARFWDALYSHDWDAVGRFFSPEANYADVGTGESGGGAHGPDQIVARLRLGLEPVERHTHEPGLVVAEGSVVVTEHLEVWWFHTGEVVRHPFTSVMEFDDAGRITRWWDYSNLSNLLDNAPQWWLEHIASGWRATLEA
ncbi:MAG: nuclear transport factor 2 family protein [Acidimicrobiaceae bacterium]|nr:nuclear transport factor 2 family protein [Acidimicrobiaceae bacterium]MDE0514780.1 nuclear transport factor 2 family protein [Acidimicrobiaceae bacterium]